MGIGAILAALLAVCPAFAQFDLATTPDGSELYFSAFPQNSPSVKIYRWTRRTGAAVFAERPDLEQRPYGALLLGTQITYSGTVLYHAAHGCPLSSGYDGNHCPVGETVAVIPQAKAFS